MFYQLRCHQGPKIWSGSRSHQKTPPFWNLVSFPRQNINLHKHNETSGDCFKNPTTLIMHLIWLADYSYIWMFRFGVKVIRNFVGIHFQRIWKTSFRRQVNTNGFRAIFCHFNPRRVKGCTHAAKNPIYTILSKPGKQTCFLPGKAGYSLIRYCANE